MRLAHVFAELDQHLAVELGVGELPDDLALRRRQRFEQLGDLGRMQRVDHALGGAHGAVVDGLAQRGEPAFFGGSARGFDHDARSVMGTFLVSKRGRG